MTEAVATEAAGRTEIFFKVYEDLVRIPSLGIPSGADFQIRAVKLWEYLTENLGAHQSANKNKALVFACLIAAMDGQPNHVLQERVVSWGMLPLIIHLKNHLQN